MLIYPVVGILVIGLGMNYVIEPVMGAINTGLNSFLVGMGSSSRIILGFVLAAMMAIDMGGPFNKAAYHSMTLCGRAKYYRYYCTYLFHVHVRNTPLRGMGFF